jgi:hypothetical protein
MRQPYLMVEEAGAAGRSETVEARERERKSIKE